jgi:hypothetical protein
MYAILSVLLIGALWVLLAGSLARVVRELMRRDLQRVARSWASDLGRLDFNLPRNLDHPLGRQVESIDDLGRVTVKKGE